MHFNPKVSIIIPVYNGSNYLKEAIDSALNQTYQRIEVIIVNDGSKDNGRTEEIARSYGKKIRYFYKENGGVASALNVGINKMTGEYFSWLSHDDVYFSNKIEEQVKILNRLDNKSCVLYSDFEIINEGSDFVCNFKINKNLGRDPLLSILSTSINGCTTLVPKHIVNSIGYFNENLKTTQDNEMWLRIYISGFKFVHVEKILLKSRCHPEQGQILMKNINRAETKAFYSWAFNEAYGDIIKFSDQILEFMATNRVNLPFFKLRTNAKCNEKISVFKIANYKYKLIVKIMVIFISKLKNASKGLILKKVMN